MDTPASHAAPREIRLRIGKLDGDRLPWDPKTLEGRSFEGVVPRAATMVDDATVSTRTMSAWRVSSPGPLSTHPLEYVDAAVAEPGADEVQVAVTAGGVCRTDLHATEDDLPVHRPHVIPVGVVEHARRCARVLGLRRSAPHRGCCGPHPVKSPHRVRPSRRWGGPRSRRCGRRAPPLTRRNQGAARRTHHVRGCRPPPTQPTPTGR